MGNTRASAGYWETSVLVLTDTNQFCGLLPITYSFYRYWCQAYGYDGDKIDRVSVLRKFSG